MSRKNWRLMAALSPLLCAGTAQGAAADQKGVAAFAAQCAVCHDETLGGREFGPALKSRQFATKWQGRANELLRFVTANMPPADPGSLPAEDYRAVVDYILGANGIAWESDRKAPDAAADNAPVKSPAAELHLGPNAPVAGAFEDQFYRRTLLERQQLLGRLTPVSQEMLNDPPVGDWLHWRRTYSNQSFSPLEQIDTQNASRLRTAWAWSLPVGGNMIAPLVHDGIMFINSANQVQALDAATGTLLWRYSRDLPQRFRGSLYTRQRNFAIAGNNLYLATGDRHVIALDVKSGSLVWDAEIVPADNPGIFLTAGPIVVGERVLQGTSVSLACKGGCSIVGLDAPTGQERWRIKTIGHSGEPGGDTWNETPDDERYGGAVWTAGAYDPQLNLAYFGTGNTYKIGALLRPPKAKKASHNDGLFTESTLALDPQSGRLVWYHQHFARELWDLDEVFERVLIDLPVGGLVRKLLVNTGKVGIMDVLDRADGKYLFSKDLGLQNLVTSIDPKTGLRTVSPKVVPEPLRPIEICPSAEGVRNSMTTAVNPHTGIMYFPLQEVCEDYTWFPNSGSTARNPYGAEYAGTEIGWTEKPHPDSDGNYGRDQAINITTGKTLWMTRRRAPPSSSMLATAGGLLFEGDRDRMFRALDAQSGAPLWEIRLNAVPNSSPITYRVNGIQYVAVVAGGGGANDVLVKEYTPEIENSTASTTLWVFRLSDQKP
jgi:alcohol dehydrogenase (cytochrome c)